MYEIKREKFEDECVEKSNALQNMIDVLRKLSNCKLYDVEYSSNDESSCINDNSESENII